MDKNKKRAELLAPAAGFLSVKAAFNAGADAVYLGGGLFGARAYADNMSEDELLKAIDYAHIHNKKIYLTVNTLLKQDEIEHKLYNYILPFYKQGLDAVIVQDLGVLSFIRKNFPYLPVHASTQMAVTGEYTPKFFQKEGIERIVTARELSLNEIRAIHNSAPDVEIESFVHGALCMGYSGLCFMSSSLGSRSGNRGRCAQSCRLNYRFINDNIKKNKRENNNLYCLSPKDLCALSILPQIIEAGVYSLKIEGRMKRAEYMCGVTEIYRKYLDMYIEDGIDSYSVSDKDMERLADLYNRGGFTSGYYTKRNGLDMMSIDRPNHFGVYAGTAKQKNDGVYLTANIELNCGDVLELRFGNKIKNKTNNKNVIDNRTEVRYNEFVIKNSVKQGDVFKLPINKQKNLDYEGVPIYRLKNESLLENLQNKYVNHDQKIRIDGKLTVICEKPLLLNIYYNDINVEVEGPVIETALKQNTDSTQLIKHLRKTGNTPFEFENINVNIEGKCFVPVKDINSIRRDAIGKLEELLLSDFRRSEFLYRDNIINCVSSDKNINKSDKCALPKISVSVSSIQQALAVCKFDEIYLCYMDIQAFTFRTESQNRIDNYNNVIAELKKCGKYIFISLPVILRKDGSDFIKNNCRWIFNNIDGVLVHNLEQLFFVKELIDENIINKIDIATNYTLYQMNSYSLDELSRLGVSRGTLPVELNKSELSKLLRNTAIPMELIVYGRMPMMFSAQCQKKISSVCDQIPENVYLQDRLGRKLLVRTNCEYCYNTIYNSEVFSLFGLEEDMRQLSPYALRLSFTTEDLDEIEHIIYNFIDKFYNMNECHTIVSSFTRGHFKKGVE